MKPFALACAAAALAGLAQAAPETAAASSQGGVATFPLVSNPAYKPNAVRAVQRAENKLMGLIQALLGNASNQNKNNTSQDGDGHTPMTDFGQDVEYYATVQVGTPPQELKLDFDTGSSDLWFASTLCLLSCNATKAKYDPSASSTYKFQGKPWIISYADGSTANGLTGTDDVNLGGLKIKNQVIEMATFESSSFSGGAVDGLLGLAFNKIATVKGIKTPVDNLIEQKLIDKPIFGVWLGKKSEGGGGEYVFGGYNEKHIDGELTTVKVNNTLGWYTVGISDLKAGSQSIVSSGFEGILDTGTTLIIFNKDIATKVAAAYNATDNKDGTYTIDCDTSKVQPLAFTMSGKDFFVPADSIVYDKDDKTGKCIAGFGYLNSEYNIIGDTFLKNNYVVFNQAVPEVQIAPSKA